MKMMILFINRPTKIYIFKSITTVAGELCNISRSGKFYVHTYMRIKLLNILNIKFTLKMI